jgi:TolA-binding protein
MKNIHLSRRVDKAKSDLEDIIEELILEVEELEDEIDNLNTTIEQMSERISELKSSIK